MKKVPLKKRISYWFDTRMANGSFGLIRLLAFVTLFMILLITCVIFFTGLGGEDGFLGALWESLSTIINAWMPSFEDGSIPYLILMSLAAIAGLFITSILIGIISSAIEEKITSLKNGNSEVIEENHIVVLGFRAGEYTLLRQLVLAAAGRPDCVVVAADEDQEEMRNYIRENVEAPKNFRIICRSADIFDPNALERCAVSSCRSVIISPTDDFSTTKALLAVSRIINNADNEKVRVGAIISKEDYRFPPSIAEKHNVSTLQTDEFISKIIAHSCMQPGLSETFRELFDYEGSELYVTDLAGAAGLTFEELMLRTDNGVPIGLCKGKSIVINPPGNRVIREDEQILVFSEEEDSAGIVEMPVIESITLENETDAAEKPAKVTIIGGGDSLKTVLRDLPENVTELILANASDTAKEEAKQIAEERVHSYAVSFFDRDLKKYPNLKKLADRSEHIVVLSDHRKEDDEADMESFFTLMNLRDIRTRFGSSYNITAEIRREANQQLIDENDNIDFVVSSNMSSLLLAQLSQSPQLLGAFRELLSNKGNELFLKDAGDLQCTGTHTVAELRSMLLSGKYLLIGYRLKDERKSRFNPPLAESVALAAGDQLIVIGEE